MLARHGKSASPVSFHECRRLFLKGALLLVKKDQENVAGIVLVHRGKELYQPLIAVKDIDRQMTLGSYAATYYTIVLANRMGMPKWILAMLFLSYKTVCFSTKENGV